MLASLALANENGDLEENFLLRPEENPIYSSLAFHSRSSSFWREHAHDYVDDLDDEARQTWLYGERVADRSSDDLADSELDEQKFDSIEVQSLALRDAKHAKPAAATPAKESKAEKKAQDNAAKAAKTAKENTAKADKKAQDQAKKTKDNTAKADKKAKNEAAKEEKQKQKDQKLVKGPII